MTTIQPEVQPSTPVRSAQDDRATAPVVAFVGTGRMGTPMAANLSIAALFEVNPSLANAMSNSLPVEMVEAIDISNAIAWLVSDEGRYVSGTVLPVDAGSLNRR